MAVRTRRGVLISGSERAAVDTGLVSFDRMRKRNLMFREEPRIGMTRPTGDRLILLGDRRQRIVLRENLVDRAMAAHAGRRLRIVIFLSPPVYAREKRVNLLAMATAALPRHQARSGLGVMRRAMATRAGLISQDCVRALG